ncbi:MAG: acyl carrier protein [Proteobacteria bacterium]|nr:acyl carrier protein [Pseudomonadota bacterium]
MAVDITKPKLDDQVIGIVSEHLRRESSKILLTSRFADDLGADSLDRVELIMKFEDKFGIEIPDEAAEKISTIQDAISYIKNQQDKA